MRNLWKPLLAGAAMAFALAATPGASQGQGCGDLNNDGNTNVIDAIIMSQCIANGGTCPSVNPGPLCGTGNLGSCGDIFEDGLFSTIGDLSTDLAALVNDLVGLDVLYGACNGPGPDLGGCPGTVTLNSSTINSNQTWPANCLVKLNGTVFVEDPNPNDDNPVVLTIEPGTTIQGIDGAPDPAALIFLVGTKIDAQGTPNNPIIFTSDQPPGLRAKGDWGGVVFNGRSTVNGPGCQFQGEGIPSPFGGCIENDSSGIATFVRVEFAGIDFTPNNELNIWTMNGIGSQTQFNFIQAHAGNDDCHEWFGGTSSHTNLVASACGDDGLDFQLGFTGSVQYGLFLQNGSLTDPGRDARGIEGDNSEFDNEAVPRSNPSFCNVTIVGANRQAGANDGTDAGILLHRGTQAQVANAIVTYFNDAGVELRDNSTTFQGCVDANDDGNPESLTGDLIVRNSLFYDNGSTAAPAGEHAKDGDNPVSGPGAANCNSQEWYALLASGFDVANPIGANTVNPNLATAYPALDNGFCTGAGTPLDCCTGSGTGSCRALYDARASISGGSVPAAACSDINPVFEDPGYIGALDPAAPCTLTGATASCDWLSKPWIELNTD